MSLLRGLDNKPCLNALLYKTQAKFLLSLKGYSCKLNASIVFCTSDDRFITMLHDAPSKMRNRAINTYYRHFLFFTSCIKTPVAKQHICSSPYTKMRARCSLNDVSQKAH